MAEDYLRQSPLANLALAAHVDADRGSAGLAMRERAFRTMVTLRGDASDAGFRTAVEQVVGAAPPAEPLSSVEAGDRRVLWLGPDEWLVVAPPEERPDLPGSIDAVLGGIHAAVTETGESMTVIELAGPRATDVLRKGCDLDLHPRAFPAGRVVRTLLAKDAIVLHKTSEAPAWEVYVHRSFSEYLWRWLEDAGLEYGVAILAE